MRPFLTVPLIGLLLATAAIAEERKSDAQLRAEGFVKVTQPDGKTYYARPLPGIAVDAQGRSYAVPVRAAAKAARDAIAGARFESPVRQMGGGGISSTSADGSSLSDTELIRRTPRTPLVPLPGAPISPSEQPQGDYASRDELVDLADTVERKTGELREQINGVESQIGGLESKIVGSVTSAVDEKLAGVRESTDAALQQAQQATQAATQAVEQTTAATQQAVRDAQVLATQAAAEQTESVKASILQRLDNLATKDEVSSKFTEAKQATGSVLVAAKETATSIVTDRIQQLDGWTVGRTLAMALGLSGPLALAVAGGSWLIARRLKRDRGAPVVAQVPFRTRAAAA